MSVYSFVLIVFLQNSFKHFGYNHKYKGFCFNIAMIFLHFFNSDLIHKLKLLHNCQYLFTIFNLGALWFPNLTIADASYILPVIVGKGGSIPNWGRGTVGKRWKF